MAILEVFKTSESSSARANLKPMEQAKAIKEFFKASESGVPGLPMEEANAILEVFKASKSSGRVRLTIDNKLPQKINIIEHKIYKQYSNNELTEEEIKLNGIREYLI